MLIADVFALPEKQWTPKDNQVSASILSVGQPKTDQYGFKQDVVLTDNTSGVSQNMTVQTKYEDGLIQSNEVGQSKMWIMKWYQSRGGKWMVGYTTTKRNVIKQAHYGTQQPQQGVQQGAQPPRQPAAQLDAAADNYAREANAKAEGMVRHGVTCAAIESKQIIISAESPINDLNYWTQYIMTGKAPPPPGQGYEGNPDELPPWES